MQKWVHLTLADGKTIDATEGHPFRTAEGWRDAVLLRKGDTLILTGRDGKPSTIQVDGIRYETKVLTTYNLEVANAHTFFVGEDAVLVHNGKGGCPRRTKHVDNRHIDRSKYPDKSKYKKPNQVDKINDKTFNNPDRVIEQGNRTRYEKDFGRDIGTDGQRTNVMVVQNDTNKIVTSYPTH